MISRPINNNQTAHDNIKANDNSNALNILFVDDNEGYHLVARRLIPNVFSPVRINLIEAYSGEQAIEIIRTGKKINLMILDDLMGTDKMLGHDVATYVKKTLKCDTTILTFSATYNGKYLDADGRLDKPMSTGSMSANTHILQLKQQGMSKPNNIFKLFGDAGNNRKIASMNASGNEQISAGLPEAQRSYGLSKQSAK